MTIETNFGLEDSQEMKSSTEPVKLEENDLETQKDIEIQTVIDETRKRL